MILAQNPNKFSLTLPIFAIILPNFYPILKLFLKYFER